jgi:hypothetical protein
MVYVIFLVLLAIVAVGPIWLWARRIEKGVEPPDRPGHEGKRFRFPKYGPIPPPGGKAGGGPM